MAINVIVEKSRIYIHIKIFHIQGFDLFFDKLQTRMYNYLFHSFLPGIDDEASMVLIGSVFTTRQQPMNEIANKILESLTYLKFQPKTSGHFSICCCQSKLLFCFIFASMSSENHFCKITKNILIISEKEMVKCLIFNHRVSSSNMTVQNVSIQFYKTSQKKY